MRIENNLYPYETATQRTSLARMASKIWILYLIKQAKYRQECLVFFFLFFFFVISADFLHREPFYFLCRFRYRLNKTPCCILWHSLSKFALSLRSEFSRHPEGLTFKGLRSEFLRLPLYLRSTKENAS